MVLRVAAAAGVADSPVVAVSCASPLCAAGAWAAGVLVFSSPRSDELNAND